MHSKCPPHKLWTFLWHDQTVKMKHLWTNKYYFSFWPFSLPQLSIITWEAAFRLKLYSRFKIFFFFFPQQSISPTCQEWEMTLPWLTIQTYWWATGLAWWLSNKESAYKAGVAGDPGSIPELGRSPGVVHGNPLQYSCLENLTDRGAWWATVHSCTKSQLQLIDWQFHFTFTFLWLR